MADVAFVFHWPIDHLEGMEIGELMGWRARAVQRYVDAHKGE